MIKRIIKNFDVQLQARTRQFEQVAQLTVDNLLVLQMPRTTRGLKESGRSGSLECRRHVSHYVLLPRSLLEHVRSPRSIGPDGAKCTPSSGRPVDRDSRRE